MAGKRNVKQLDFKRFLKHARAIGIIIATLLLIVYLIAIVLSSPAYYTKMAAREASINFNNDMKQVSKYAEEHYERLYAVADKLKYAEANETIRDVLREYADIAEIGELRYFVQDVAYIYGTDGLEKHERLDDQVIALATGNSVGCTAVYYDRDLRCDCIAFFVPVRGSVRIDGLISVVPVSSIVSVGDTMQENTSVIAVIGRGGTILSSSAAEYFGYEVGVNIYDLLQKLTEKKEEVDTVRNILSSDKAEVVEISTAKGNYTVAAEPIGAFDDHMYLLTLSESSRLVPVEFDYVGHLTFVLILAIGALSVVAVFAIIFRRKVDEAVSSVNLINATLECPNVEGFKKNAAKMLHKNNRNYAVAAFSLKRFHFIEDQFGAESSTNLLKYIKEVLLALCHENETFGYVGDGKFLLLVDFRNEQVFRNRLLVFEAVINKYDLLKNNQVKMQVAAGLYVIVEDQQKSVADMIDCANIMCEEAKKNSQLTYEVYTDSVREKINQNEHLEARMESALSSNEFRLFLQPKYNVSGDEIDSAEALVRWFDYQKGDYRYPAEFISLFESNGFIVEMDHFIYIEVLKYLSEARARGDKTVPISVNVSRVTAANADFMDFYIGNKQRYMIDDGLITLEFTESYATEDYEKLSEIITALHEGGIRCSIDDFGVGYSSFRILKELDMDELKLDRLFLDKGIDIDRDDKILTTITALAKSCGMTVVMEGVENKAMYDRVVRFGIGVIQGYYYAKPIPLEEFKIFVKSNTSIRYKAVVK